MLLAAASELGNHPSMWPATACELDSHSELVSYCSWPTSAPWFGFKIAAGAVENLTAQPVLQQSAGQSSLDHSSVRREQCRAYQIGIKSTLVLDPVGR